MVTLHVFDRVVFQRADQFVAHHIAHGEVRGIQRLRHHGGHVGARPTLAATHQR